MLSSLGGQFCDVVLAAPLLDISVQIDADRVVGSSSANPLARRIRGAAEIFAQPLCLTPAQLAIGIVDEVDFGFHTLDGVFVQQVPIGALGHCQPLLFFWNVRTLRPC